jgi:hypothetical protein
MNLRSIDAHVLICEPRIGIATEIDVLCRDETTMVVIENKTTLQTQADHLWSYKKPDRKSPHLLGDYAGLANNEYTHQQLQLCHMLIMLELGYQVPANLLTGYVLVASADGINVYPVDSQLRSLVRSTLTRRIMFGRIAPVPAVPNFPLLGYRFRAFIPPTEQPPPLLCPPLLTRFLKSKQLAFAGCTKIGAYSFHERPDLVFDTFADFYAENATTVYIFLCRETTLTVAECAVLDSPLTKLPTDQPSSLLAKWMLELAIVVNSRRPCLVKQKVHARLILLGPKPCMRTLSPRLLSHLK